MAPGLCAILPFYYFPGTAGEIRVLLVDPSDLEPEAMVETAPIGVFSVAELEDAGGILVEGSIDDSQVRLVGWAEVAEEMGVSEAELDRRRTELLTP